jgi:CheY-like chemotaxis protein
VIAGGSGPDLDALELTRWMRSSAGPEGPHGIVLSGPEGAPDAAQLTSLGLSGVLNQPVSHRRLRGLLLELGVLTKTAPAADGERAAGRAADPQALAAAGGPVSRILLAEDNAVNQKVAHLMLTRLGYEVDVVGNGREALAALAARDYAAVLMDVQMPEMDGLEATRRIRAEDSPARNPRIPIIALTAHAMKEDRQRSLAAGMDDHAAKPINSAIIRQILGRHLAAESHPVRVP